MQYIDWKEIDFVRVGNSTDQENKTGLTVLYFPKGALGGVHVSGGGPASREMAVLSPETNATPVNALVLGGGSAFGLAASDGVMAALEERGEGFPTAYGVVPIVCASHIFDLAYGNPKVRPDAKMGREAFLAAVSESLPLSGNIGAGTGATVGKLKGMQRAMKGGIGYAAAKVGDLIVGAVVVVNALGNIYDSEGKLMAGLMDESRSRIMDSGEMLYEMYEENSGMKTTHSMFGRTKVTTPMKRSSRAKATDSALNLLNNRSNTTIGAIVTNGQFNKGELTKIAMMATNGYARSIRPVGTEADGDTVYAFTSGAIKGDVNVAGTLAAEMMSTAIERAIYSSAMSNENFLAHVK